ncbi:DNA alkylation repair protein [Gordonia sp. (in: high G+C Gram-positive bacteria)]|uniref:DNA alkylation repair protein n=1 Tax=Gordonia sp. (in: high G+C Gram-positive bacteria) TaxID=84139 RepID=UPI00260A0304|nr:DNA alkylation repair protein [Gordonia sp. (in: high G+C Gram-positive bacteria)]HMS74915.1 DNA alkylation repair protein [Gordonia sp. (in: high G+C Gram-positive bacteria)]
MSPSTVQAPEQTAQAVMDALSRIASPERAASSARFFKTGPGEYGEGDLFVGVTVPDQRKVLRSFRNLPLTELTRLIDSPFHEHRLCAVIGATERFRRGTGEREAISGWYLDAAYRGRINNWDIVDTSAGPILGGLLYDRPRGLLFELARSTGGGPNDLWLRRIAIIATQEFINRGDASTTLELAPIYLDYPDDLLQKATGWMLREVGKRVDRDFLIGFLDEYAARMPRTMLGYAVEHLTVERRRHYRSLK